MQSCLAYLQLSWCASRRHIDHLRLVALSLPCLHDVFARRPRFFIALSLRCSRWEARCIVSAFIHATMSDSELSQNVCCRIINCSFAVDEVQVFIFLCCFTAMELLKYCYALPAFYFPPSTSRLRVLLFVSSLSLLTLHFQPFNSNLFFPYFLIFLSSSLLIPALHFVPFISRPSFRAFYFLPVRTLRSSLASLLPAVYFRLQCTRVSVILADHRSPVCSLNLRR